MQHYTNAFISTNSDAQVDVYYALYSVKRLMINYAIPTMKSRFNILLKLNVLKIYYWIDRIHKSKNWTAYRNPMWCKIQIKLKNWSNFITETERNPQNLYKLTIRSANFSQVKNKFTSRSNIWQEREAISFCKLWICFRRASFWFVKAAAELQHGKCLAWTFTVASECK